MLIETEHLRLRELVADDAPFILELLNDADFHRYIGDRGVRTLDQARHYIEQGPRVSYGRHGFGLGMVEGRSDGVPMGICGFVKRDHLEHVDIGYAFLPAFRGRGLALEAARAVLLDGRRRLGIERVLGVVTPENHASIRLLERLGLRLQGRVMMGQDECLLLALTPGD